MSTLEYALAAFALLAGAGALLTAFASSRVFALCVALSTVAAAVWLASNVVWLALWAAAPFFARELYALWTNPVPESAGPAQETQTRFHQIGAALLPGLVVLLWFAAALPNAALLPLLPLDAPADHAKSSGIFLQELTAHPLAALSGPAFLGLALIALGLARRRVRD